MYTIVKAKTKKGQRVLQKREPKLHETLKRVVILHGTKTSATLKSALSEVYHLKKPGDQAVKLTKKNDNVRPFEGGGEASLEFISQKTDCSLFLFGTHSKKRPHNMVLGRMFDHHLYDMVELGVDRFRSLKDFGSAGVEAMAGSKPCIVFAGDEFETLEEFKMVKSLLLDLLRGEVVDTINLKGLDRVFVCVATGGKVHLRHCAIKLKKSGTKIPRVELKEMGPSMTLSVRRHRSASDDLQRVAMKRVPKPAKKKVKNVSMDNIKGKVGRIYMPKQEVDKMALSKLKGVKRERREKAATRAQNRSGASGAEQRQESGRGLPALQPPSKKQKR